MPALSIFLDGPEAFTPIPSGATVHHVTKAMEVALLEGGMASGKPSVMLRLELPDGSVVIAETSLALFMMAADAFEARHPRPEATPAEKEAAERAVAQIARAYGVAPPATPAPAPVEGSLKDTREGLDTSLGPDGQQREYLVLSVEERAKGYVRPVRRTYIHVGREPVMKGHVLIKPGNGACGTRTTMGRAIAETYARDPRFYSATFCATCRDHFPVGADGEFIWEGTTEKVGM